MALTPRQQRLMDRRTRLNSMPIPDRAKFSPEQLQQFGSRLGDSAAFTDHPMAQQSWESNIRRGNINPAQMLGGSVQAGTAVQPGTTPLGGRPGGVLSDDSNYGDYYNGQPSGASGPPGYGESYGLKGAEAALLAGQGMAQDTIGQGYDAAGDLVRQYGERASTGLRPYAEQGQGASQRQAALSGAMGPEAQAEAYASFQSSPGQDYLRSQAEKSLLRNSAAIGGLGGGNVRSALQEQAVGMAAQDFGNSFNRLTGVADRGFNASQLLSGIEAGVGDRLSGLETERAGTVSGMQYGTGGNLANYRTRAGEQLAGQYGNTSSQLSQLQRDFGNQLTDQMGETGGNLAQLLAGAGQSDAQMTQQLAALLANISTGSGSQAAGLPGIPGTQQKEGAIGDIGKTAMAAAALFSDSRLKTNISRVGRMPSGVNLYRWDWNEAGKAVAGNQPGYGVLAQEVPWAAVEGPGGYLMVDYGRV